MSSKLKLPAKISKKVGAGVGKHHGNLPADVKIVQELLNRVAPDDGGPRKLLPGFGGDGAIDDATINAISVFQAASMQVAWPDGVVAPGGKTLACLNEFARLPKGWITPDKEFVGAKLYNQGNPEWSRDRMNGQNTLGESGCAVSALASALAGWGNTINGDRATPKTLNAWLNANSGYVGMNLSWVTVGNWGYRGLPNVELIGIYGSSISHPAVEPVMLDAETMCGFVGNGQTVICHLKARNHWVLLTGSNYGAAYLVMDPDGGIERIYRYDELKTCVVFDIPLLCAA